MADKTLNQGSSTLNDTPYNHKWGFTDTKFVAHDNYVVTMTGERYLLSGKELPYFLPFVEETLKIKINFNDLKIERPDKPIAPPNKNEGFCQAIAKAFSNKQFTFDDTERLVHSHGQTTADEVYKVLYGALDRVVDMVIFCESEEDAQTIIDLAKKHDVCLIPYGGGTSVSCALKLPEKDLRMMVSVDTRRMNKIQWLDEDNFLACIEAGISGKELEEQLNARGYTSGHEPDSLELSTLGGWIATNASGMKKNRYGNIEDIVESFTMITPQGVIEQQAMSRVSIGMQPHKLLFGNEGNLGLITKAVLRIHKFPEVKKYGSIVFKDFKTGGDYLYELTQKGVLPASIRLLDNIQFRFGSALKPRASKLEELESKVQKLFLLDIKKFDPEELCAATIVMEGTKEEVAYQEKVIKSLARKYGGVWGGEGNGQRGYMLTYAIAYIRDFLADFHIIGETYETTVPWSKIHDVCEAVSKRAVELHEHYGLPGVPYVSPRLTQMYHTGVCIYFTHGFSAQGVDDPDRIFAHIEHEMRDVIMKNGGSVSHHHGIGKLRKDFMDQTISETGIELLRQIKEAHDPQNVFGIRNNIFTE